MNLKQFCVNFVRSSFTNFVLTSFINSANFLPYLKYLSLLIT